MHHSRDRCVNLCSKTSKAVAAAELLNLFTTVDDFQVDLLLENGFKHVSSFPMQTNLQISTLSLRNGYSFGVILQILRGTHTAKTLKSLETALIFIDDIEDTGKFFQEVRSCLTHLSMGICPALNHGGYSGKKTHSKILDCN